MPLTTTFAPVQLVSKTFLIAGEVGMYPPGSWLGHESDPPVEPHSHSLFNSTLHLLSQMNSLNGQHYIHAEPYP